MLNVQCTFIHFIHLKLISKNSLAYLLFLPELPTGYKNKSKAKNSPYNFIFFLDCGYPGQNMSLVSLVVVRSVQMGLSFGCGLVIAGIPPCSRAVCAEHKPRFLHPFSGNNDMKEIYLNMTSNNIQSFNCDDISLLVERGENPRLIIKMMQCTYGPNQS